MTSSPRMKSMFGGTPQGGFLDLPTANPGDQKTADIVVVGAPAATPYSSVGNYCAAAPDAVRAAFGWPGVLAHHDFDIDGELLPPGVTALDRGNLEYSETDFAANIAPPMWTDLISKTAAMVAPKIQSSDGI